MPPPYITTDLPGTGGLLRREIDDFVVVEIPAYEPCGAGDHIFAWIEKRGLSSADAVAQLARAVGVSPADVGCAGLKDRWAVTQQSLSFPPPVTPEALLAVQIPGIRVLHARRHAHKLRTGHLQGNRFRLRLRQVDGDADTAAARARAILARLSQPPGCPNWFGSQRFGRDGDNAELGRALVVGEAGGGRRAARGRRRRLLISAYQSQLFNEVLLRRIGDGLFARVLEGDIVEKTDTGGVFASHQPACDQIRLERGEIALTGPIFGHRAAMPPAGTPAAAREEAILSAHALELGDFKNVGRLGRGSRRPLGVCVSDHQVTPIAERTIELSFHLPRGAYATCVMDEIVKGNTA